ncbi:DUF998 domain-containing protein [Streptomyces phaeochromogenes]|uniref:DUF998 domain-containing protein n=1 Tax=Streptomyces phaeochromogenes TaxID=1923 RepID=A0ABZ1HHZ4_STRPH|nr:DUF998 domain-containing protein [Streptomyces phaeochromogenes]WSD18232.1 DUF998 domain-containing protein [Streptomyces phaeochromogenes]
MTTSRTAVAALLGLGALTYSAWALEAVLTTDLAPAHTYVSELAARNQPHGSLFRTTDLLAGTLVWAAGLLASLRPPFPGRWTRAGWVALVLFGTATAVDSRLPLSCAPTADPACAAQERAGLLPLAHSAHSVSSTVALCGILVAMVALTLTARRYAPRAPLARSGPALVTLELAATVWTLAAIAALEAGHDGWGLGVAQRLQVGVIAVWLGVLAVSLVRPMTPVVLLGDRVLDVHGRERVTSGSGDTRP